MDSLQNIFDKQQKQATLPNILNITSLQVITTIMESLKINNSNSFSRIAMAQGIEGAWRKQHRNCLSEILKANAMLKTNTELANFLNSSTIIAANPLMTKLATTKSPFLELTASLAKISQVNKLWTNNISNILTSQVYLASSLQNALRCVNSQHQAAFNNLNIALTGISKSFLKNTITIEQWEEINIVEETNTIISSVINETDSKECIISTNDVFENYKESIVSELSKLLYKTKSQRVKEYVLELITVISLLFSIYSHNTSLKQEDISNTIKNELSFKYKFLTKEIENVINKYISKTRVARINAKLRYADKKNTKIIGTVKQGQQVTIIEIRHKYLLVSYLDKDTGEPKSGFVLKKYFR